MSGTGAQDHGTGQRAPALGRRSMVGNLAAQGVAVCMVFVASLLVARLSGAEVLGEYALLRVLPWLTGVVVSRGLPLASAYFLAGERRDDPGLRPTLALLAAAGSALGALLWLAAVPLLDGLFTTVPRWQPALLAVTVITQPPPCGARPAARDRPTCGAPTWSSSRRNCSSCPPTGWP